MKDNFIQLKSNDVLRLIIRDEEGKETGDVLEFDLEDIELPLRYQELIEKDKKNKEQLKNQVMIIDRRQDVKGKKLLSKNEEDKIKAINEFFKKEASVYDEFLGKDGIKKLTAGRKLGWTTFEEVDEIIEKQIIPHLNVNMEKLTDKVKKMYGKAVEKSKELDVLE